MAEPPKSSLIQPHLVGFTFHVCVLHPRFFSQCKRVTGGDCDLRDRARSRRNRSATASASAALHLTRGQAHRCFAFRTTTRSITRQFSTGDMKTRECCTQTATGGRRACDSRAPAVAPPRGLLYFHSKTPVDAFRYDIASTLSARARIPTQTREIRLSVVSPSGTRFCTLYTSLRILLGCCSSTVRADGSFGEIWNVWRIGI